MSVLFYDVGTTDTVIGGTSFGTHTEQLVSCQRVTLKRGGEYLDGSPYILPLDKPYFVLKLNFLNDTERFIRRSRGNTFGTNLDIQEQMLRLLAAPPFSWRVGFASTTFDPVKAFPYSSEPWTELTVPRRPFQIIDDLRFRHGGSLSDGWAHSLTLHVLPLGIDLVP